jgi:hypothetical protein
MIDKSPTTNSIFAIDGYTDTLFNLVIKNLPKFQLTNLII